MMMTTMVSDAYPGAAGMYGDMGPSPRHFMVDNLIPSGGADYLHNIV